MLLISRGAHHGREADGEARRAGEELATSAGAQAESCKRDRNGQLAERYAIKRAWAQDWWHPSHRLIRKVLSHTVLAWVMACYGWSPLQFDRLRQAAQKLAHGVC